MRKLIIIVALVLLAVGAYGQNTIGTAKYLHDGWLAYQKASGPNGFNGLSSSEANYMGNFTGYLLATIRLEEYALNWFRIPANVSYDQMFAMVGQYLDKHPEKWNEDAALVIDDIFSAYYPPKK